MSSAGYFDIHNHILPGVDDGSSCLEETLDLVASEYSQGIRNIIFTPHFRVGMFNVEPEERYSVFCETVAVLQKKYPDMSFYYGCEYYLNEESMRTVNAPYNRMLCGNIILAEFNYRIPFPAMFKLITNLLSSGVTVIIAHVERYICMREDMSRVAKLRDMGVYIQINADAVIGKDGFTLKNYSRKLLKEDLVDFLASDGHTVEGRPVRMDAAIKFIEKKYGMEYVEQLLIENPKRLFGL